MMEEARSTRYSILYSIASAYFMSWPITFGLVFITICSIALAILETYIAIAKELTFILEIVFFFIFFVDMIFDLLRAPFLLEFFFSLDFFYDIMACISVFALIFPENDWLQFFRFFRIFKLLEVLRLKRSWAVESGLKVAYEDTDGLGAYQSSTVAYSVANLVVNILAFFIFFSAAIYYLGLQPLQFVVMGVDPRHQSLSFGEAFYFCIVTITTVGYGDILPFSAEAKTLTILMIILGFSIIPQQIASLVSAITAAHEYQGQFRTDKHKKHVLMCGAVDHELLSHACGEFFPFNAIDETANDTHGPGGHLMLAVLTNEEPNEHIKMLLLRYKGWLCYLQGNAKNFSDLRRAKAHRAAAIIVLPDRGSSSLRDEEDSTFLSCIAVTKFLDSSFHTSRCNVNDNDSLSFSVQREVRKLESNNFVTAMQDNRAKDQGRGRIIVKLTVSARNETLLRAMGVDVIVKFADLKYALLAVGSVLPGFLACFQSLVGCAGSGSRHRERGMPVQCWTVHQVSRQHVHSELLSMDFHRALHCLYVASAGMVFLVAAEVNRQVTINPADTLLNEYSNFLALAPSFDIARQCFARRPVRGHLPAANARRWHQSQSRNAVRNSDAAAQTSPSDETSSSPRSASGSAKVGPLRINPFLHVAQRALSRKDENAFDFMQLAALPNDIAGHHVLLLLLPSAGALVLTPHQLMLPIIHFLRALRAYSSASVIVFFERAHELLPLVHDVEEVAIGLMQNVHFVTGQPRRPADLFQCRVRDARTVSVMKMPCVSERSSQHISQLSVVAEDKQVIIASLNLHLLLAGQTLGNVGDHSSGEVSSGAIVPFVAVEIAHEANTLFLRPRHEHDDQKEDEIAEDTIQEQVEADTSLLRSGGILTQCCLDNLLIQSVYYPAINSFWENGESKSFVLVRYCMLITRLTYT